MDLHILVLGHGPAYTLIASHSWLVPHETAAVSAQVLCTLYNHAPCHFMQSRIRKVYAYLAVTWHLHFWQNDQDLLRATAVTRGWNEYRRNKSQHWKMTLEKKILSPLLQGFYPRPFRHESGALTTKLSSSLDDVELHVLGCRLTY